MSVAFRTTLTFSPGTTVIALGENENALAVTLISRPPAMVGSELWPPCELLPPQADAARTATRQKGRRRMTPPTLWSLRLYQGIVLEELLGRRLRVFLVDLDRLVQVDQLVGGELGRDLVDEVLGLVVELLGADDGHDVAGLLEVLVVLEQ